MTREASQPNRTTANAAEELAVTLKQIRMGGQLVEPEPKDLSNFNRMWYRLDWLSDRHSPPGQGGSPGSDTPPDPGQRHHPNGEFFLTFPDDSLVVNLSRLDMAARKTDPAAGPQGGTATNRQKQIVPTDDCHHPMAPD